jgi:hypothetical protein
VNWAAVALGVGSAAVTAAAALGAVWLQGSISEREARRRERIEHEREGRDVVVDLAMMVRESDHIRYAVNTSQAMLDELVQRREGLRPLEKRLMLWAAEDEDPTMAKRCGDFIAAVDRTVWATGLSGVRDRSTPGASG